MEDLSDELRERALSFMRSVALRCPDPFYTCDPADGFRFTFVNEGACVHFGRSRKELLSLSLVEVDASLSPADWRRIWEELKETGSLFFETIHRHASGREIPVAISVNRFSLAGRDQFGGCIHNLQGQQGEEILRTRELLQSLVDGSPDLVAAVDQDLHLLCFNRAFVEILQRRYGITPHLKQSLPELLAEQPEVLARVQPLWERALQGETFSVSAQILQADGEPRIYDLRFSPVQGSDGNLLGAAHIGTDVTERVAYEQVLEQAKETAEEANRIKSAFLANMSHELRTPLTVVLGALELLLESEPTESQRLLIDMAQKGGQNLLSIIEDLLDFCRIEGGRISLRRSTFSLRDCLEKILEIFRLPARHKGLDLYLTIDPKLPSSLEGDPDRLTQVLVNLVSNAQKFTDEGEIEISALREGDSQVRFSVRDTGIGIAPDKQRLMLEPFTQADVSNTRRFGGTGLGLAISRELVSLMGGELIVQSEPGAGSTFSFCLPLLPIDLPNSPPEPEGEPEPENKTKSGRLLLAEDDPVVRDMLHMMLTRGGWKIEMAADGEEAVEKWREGPFDIVLMDLQMPRLSGLEATRKIRELEQGRRTDSTCIIALTAHAGHKMREQCVKTGMDDFVVKPVRGSHLLALIDMCLYRRKS